LLVVIFSIRCSETLAVAIRRGWYAKRLTPQVASDRDRVDTGILPPSLLVSGPVNLAMMRPAKGNRELITDFAAERAWLGKSQVMGVRRSMPAYQAAQ
jgi:hypothetical protein